MAVGGQQQPRSVRHLKDDRGLFLGDHHTVMLLKVVIPAQAGIHVDPRFREGDRRTNPRSIQIAN